jgi:flap endonuclease-1
VLSDIIDRLQVTREQLIEIGILVGTDFNQGIGVSAERQR